jgi:hypothetical protein
MIFGESRTHRRETAQAKKFSCAMSVWVAYGTIFPEGVREERDFHMHINCAMLHLVVRSESSDLIDRQGTCRVSLHRLAFRISLWWSRADKSAELPQQLSSVRLRATSNASAGVNVTLVAYLLSFIPVGCSISRVVQELIYRVNWTQDRLLP